MKILHLNLYRKYFDEIANGTKTIEYRDMHSLSVGDIIAEVPQVGYEVMEVADIVKQTRYFIVEGFGFSDITDIIHGSDIAINRIKESA